MLVTGAAGGLGRAVVGVLIEGGWRVRALEHRRPVSRAHERLRGDLAHAAGLRRAVEGTDGVIHLAAITHSRRPGRYREINVEGTRLLVEAAADAGSGRFVYVSSRAICAQGGAYSRSKRTAEELVRAAACDWVIVRPPEVYGAGALEGVDRIITSARAHRPILLAGRGRHPICPAHAADVAAAVVAALDAPQASRRTYTLAGPCMTVRELADACVETLGSTSRVWPVPMLALRGAAPLARVLPLPLYPDQLARLRAPKPPASPEARADLGFSPRTLREGLGSA